MSYRTCIGSDSNRCSHYKHVISWPRISGVLGGIRGYTPYTNLRDFLTVYRLLTSVIINKQGTSRPFATPFWCVYPPPFLAISHCLESNTNCRKIQSPDKRSHFLAATGKNHIALVSLSSTFMNRCRLINTHSFELNSLISLLSMYRHSIEKQREIGVTS